MVEVGGITETNFKEIEMEVAIRKAVVSPESMTKFLMNLCKKNQEMKEEITQLKQDIKTLSSGKVV